MDNRPRKLICRRCGEPIDIRTKRADGSLQCPNCKVIYRPRSEQSQQRNHARKPQKRRKSMKLIAGIAFLLLLLIILVGSCGNNENDTITSPIQEQPINEIDSNTTAKVDDLITKAKADAESANAADLASNAWKWIVDTVPEWYDSNEIMEKAIYNGALVEYYFTDKDDIRAEVGMDTVQAVKYVYRGAEAVLDDATQENIQQVKEGIEKVSTSGGYPTLRFGELLNITETPTYLFDEKDQFVGTGNDIVVVKAKISPSYNNKATIKQNYLNIEDLIQNQGFDKYNELQYWAVADMTDGSEGKVFSCTVSDSLIKSIKENAISVERYNVMVDDLWILPSLLE